MVRGRGKECRLEYLATVRSCARVVCNCELYGTFAFVNLQTGILDDYLLNMRNICLTTSQVTSGSGFKPDVSAKYLGSRRLSLTWQCLFVVVLYVFFLFPYGEDNNVV